MPSLGRCSFAYKRAKSKRSQISSLSNAIACFKRTMAFWMSSAASAWRISKSSRIWVNFSLSLGDSWALASCCNTGPSSSSRCKRLRTLAYVKRRDIASEEGLASALRIRLKASSVLSAPNKNRTFALVISGSLGASRKPSFITAKPLSTEPRLS